MVNDNTGTSSQKKRNIIRVDSAGFCWGVERAINMAEELSNNGTTRVYTDGPLIHNKQMMEKLEASNVREVGDYLSQSEINLNKEEHTPEKDSIMLVRAHGISPERRKYLRSLGLKFKDATCPDVGIVAGRLRLHARKGFSAVIFGTLNHPEVIGLLGYTEDRGYAVQSKEDIDNLPDLGDKVCMVSQTTMFVDDYNELADYLKQKYPSVVVLDTICSATKERQGDVLKLIQQGAEAVVVIGGKHSSNTKKLAMLVERNGIPAFHVETKNDLDLEVLSRYQNIGVTAGASTPDFLIDSVCETLKQL